MPTEYILGMVGNQFGLTVGFFLGSRLINGRNYLLRTRPEENAMRCLHRVKSRIEASVFAPSRKKNSLRGAQDMERLTGRDTRYRRLLFQFDVRKNSSWWEY